MIGRLLCKIRLHKWQRHTYRYAQWTECDRCEAVKDEGPTPITFTMEKRG